VKHEKNKSEKKKLPLKRTLSNNLFALKAVWAGSKTYFIVYISCSFIFGILEFLSGSYLLRKIVNSFDSGEGLSDILTYVSVLGTVAIVLGVMDVYFWNVVSPVFQRKIAASIEKKLFCKSRDVELACYETPSFYDKYVKAMDEAYQRMMKVMRSLNMLFSRFIALFANSLLLFLIDPWLILFGICPLLFGFFRRMEQVKGHDLSVARKPIDRRANYVRRTFYLGEFSKEMRIGGMYENMLRDLKDTYEEFKALIYKHATKRAVYGYIQRVGLEVITILGATFYSVWSAMCVGSANGGMRIGDCIVVLSSIGTISYCLNNLIQNFAEFAEHALYLEDVRFFLDYEPSLKDGGLTVDESVRGVIEVNNISFRYEGAENDTIKNVSFTLKQGERIALVGSNGSGKTTLVKLLLRLYDSGEGEILLNGKNIKEYELDSYRGSFSTVFQDFKMFSMTIQDNIMLRSREEGDEEKVISALKESGAYEKVSKFEKGIDTVLTREFDDEGKNLSVGEQQKISLARIFANNTPFVILDEPSSALDPIAEYKMFENMMRATEGRGVIFISHRLSSAVLADKVLLMEDGSIVECGTHKELMSIKGKYAAMFNRQAENYLGSEAENDE